MASARCSAPARWPQTSVRPHTGTHAPACDHRPGIPWCQPEGARQGGGDRPMSRSGGGAQGHANQLAAAPYGADIERVAGAALCRGCRDAGWGQRLQAYAGMLGGYQGNGCSSARTLCPHARTHTHRRLHLHLQGAPPGSVRHARPAHPPTTAPNRPPSTKHPAPTPHPHDAARHPAPTPHLHDAALAQVLHAPHEALHRLAVRAGARGHGDAAGLGLPLHQQPPDLPGEGGGQGFRVWGVRFQVLGGGMSGARAHGARPQAQAVGEAWR